MFPNQKPWFDRNVQSLLRAMNATHRSGDRLAYSNARRELKKGIKKPNTDTSSHHNDTTLPDALNPFFARIDNHTSRGETQTAPPSREEPTLVFECYQVRSTFRGTDINKAAGPGRIPGRTLKLCADQLAGVFTNIFNLSLQQAVIPTCLKSTTIFPLPKNTTIPTVLDSHQFAYCRNTSTEDAISFVLYTSLSHLEHPNTPQNVGNHTSSTLILNTGAPQGCVLSPSLFTLFTHDFKPIHSSNTKVKIADDTTIVGLISENNEIYYREEVQHLVEWCVDSDLVLNTTKTKEIIVDYRRTRKTTPPHKW
ncbi:putative RNA-directed DNA polymerase from transposon BS [Labeo rohita]|uniref:RNA-directed DNA polymerase from transposon BS n=1 Tax=Labeo rohita TaxID=84645 RepID=A0ABQ8LRD5_LABRO|nr:putative RNA-directed DNA polymerase from transposon BS [Labeo rohita]